MNRHHSVCPNGRQRTHNLGKKNLLRLESIFATQVISQWMDKSGLRQELLNLKRTLPVLNAKVVRQFFDDNASRFGWTPKERRTYKRAAVLIMRQL